jgi:hypothetical protein
MRAIDLVQLRGWSPDTTRRAIAALSDATTRAGELRHQPLDLASRVSTRDDNELATELVRWLRCAAEADPEDLVDHLDAIRPSGPDASPWDRLGIILDKEQSLDGTIAELKESHTDPVTALCTLLDATEPSFAQFSELDRTCQRAVEALTALGSHESLRYLVSHLGLLCSDTIEPLRSLMMPHDGAFISVATEVWPSLTWAERVMLMLYFDEHQIPKDSLVDLVLATDESMMTYEELAQFVEVLAFANDARAERTIHKLIEAALEEVASHRSAEVVHFVEFTAHTLVAEMEREFPSDLYDRAVALGFEFSQRHEPSPVS